MTANKITFGTLKAAPSQLKRKEITVPEWGGGRFSIVEISAMMHKEIVPKIQELGKKDEEGHVPQQQAGVLASTWCSYLMEDVDGKNPEFDWLMTQSLKLVTSLAKQALTFNGLSDEVEEDPEKNSPAPEAENSSE